VGGFLLVSIVFAVWTMVWGVSGVLTIKPEYLLSQWEKKGQMDDLNAWKNAHRSLELANRINPGNPNIMLGMASIYEWRAMQSPIWTSYARDYRTKSVNKYRQVLKNRPTWGIAWASLAQNKFLLQEVDHEMWSSMSNAIKYAPWEIAVQRKIIWLGIATWKISPQDLKVQVKKIIIGGLRNPYLRDFVLKTVVQYQWQENLKLLLDKSEEKRLIKLIQIRDRNAVS
jgi:hypothetical protein